jgi:superfamily II DNA or RNA helicase
MNNAIINNQNPLYYELKKDLVKASSVKILVSFLRESGAKLIVPLLKDMSEDTHITLITGRYLNITEPSAIYYLKQQLGNRITIKFYDKNVVSFHPKVYIIEKPENDILYIGSSNISHAALLDGIEWNYRLNKVSDIESYDRFITEFNRIDDDFSIIATDEIIKKYKKEWEKTKVGNKLDDYEKGMITDKEISPRGAQIEALYELSNARKEGVKKGIVAAATGIGKTYLGAFDTDQFSKVLFVAHREEILNQAKASFENIYGDTKSYGFFKGSRKDLNSDIVFASVQSLGKEEYLNENYFASNAFDYIIIDEFHHAAADTYSRVLEYFNPSFLLGLTATPYRMDNQDIFKLCDDNLIYELTLKEAINRELLSPFDYYAVYDLVDYEAIELVNGKYKSSDLEKKLSTHERSELVLNHFKDFSGEKTLAFCASINHAEFMAKEFKEAGYKVATVHSGSIESENMLLRHKAIRMLDQGDIDVLFTIDMFNEGVDIPSVDTVLFLRPTESYVIFLQQLGRGLRLDDNNQRKRLTVLDFIGNYKRAHFVPKILSGENPFESKKKSSNIKDFKFPKDCNIQFDFKLINLFKELERTDPIRKQMTEEYFRMKALLNRRPLRVDIYEGVDLDFNHFRLKSNHGFNGYFDFLKYIKELTEEEKNWIGKIPELFLKELNKTSMSKSYKIPVLQTFIGEEGLKNKVSLRDIGLNFQIFYQDNKLHQKDLNNKRHKGWENWNTEKFMKEALMNPIKFLNKSEFFNYDEINKEFRLKDEIINYNSKMLKRHFEDIIEYRKINYFARRY